ncbi:MAG: threonine synthase, partial [Nitrospinae bacterium]|nr:threonine synthase [Nitrospinota bacterium]
MGHVKGLRCKECGKKFEKLPIHVCEFCFGPLEVEYDYDAIKKVISRKSIEAGPPTMWRYREFMPIDEEPKVGLHVGYTPLVRAKNLGKALGLNKLYIKNDSVNHPTFSFKDRVVSVAISKAIEFGFTTVACASTGNLANSVAAHGAAAGMKVFVFIPADLEAAKVLGSLIYGARIIAIHGTYDEVNRLCSEIANKYPWAFANINIRPFYAEGSKALAFEVAEQLGWRLPRHTIVPMAGGSLITKVAKAYREFAQLGLVEETPAKCWGAQATGCNPITRAVKDDTDLIRPVKQPKTIAKSLAIGNPADGYYAFKVMKETGGGGEDVTDEEIVDSIRMLAETEGVFAETAGGVTLGVLRKLLAQGRIPPEESIVLAITGNGFKTQEAVAGHLPQPEQINAKFEEFEALVEGEEMEYMTLLLVDPQGVIVDTATSRGGGVVVAFVTKKLETGGSCSIRARQHS